ncbi:MAG: GtrA family protein [Capsulimonadaceae bacterium]
MIAQETVAVQPPRDNKVFRQLVKFCIVGASSTVVNFAILNVMLYLVRLPIVPSLTLAFFISVGNGFIWNRRWTFKESRNQAAHEQLVPFVLINIVGWLLNTAIVVLIIARFQGGAGVAGNWHLVLAIAKTIVLGGAHKMYPPLIVNGSQFLASMVVVFWNFFANRKWTFKH